jgi:CBS domain-containing protein
MNRMVVAVDIDDTVEAVEQLLHSGIYSFVPVLEPDGTPFGVISACDLVNFHARHGKAKLNRSWEVCTHKVLAIPPDTPVEDAAQMMLDKHVHHLVVMDHGHVAGVVSTLDLLGKYLHPSPEEAHTAS